MATILVIDDDELVGRTIGRVLTRHGHQAVIATTASQAYALFTEHCPALVVSDLIMPEQNGIEVIRELRMRDPQVKIILVTGGSDTYGAAFLEVLEPLNFNALLKKPFEINDLLNEVNLLLEPM